MKKSIMVIRDIKGNLFIQPHVVETVEIAIRDFTEAANDPKKQTTLSKYPADYDLIYIGTFDPETGDIASLPPEIAFHGKHIGQSKSEKYAKEDHLETENKSTQQT